MKAPSSAPKTRTAGLHPSTWTPPIIRRTRNRRRGCVDADEFDLVRSSLWGWFWSAGVLGEGVINVISGAAAVGMMTNRGKNGGQCTMSSATYGDHDRHRHLSHS